MPWTEITRLENDRSDLRYASDCRDDEWELIAPIVEIRSVVGRPCTVDMRAIWNTIQYIATIGCQWRQLPKDFPPVSTVRYYFYRFRNNGTFVVINDLLSVARCELSIGCPFDPCYGDWRYHTSNIHGETE